MDSSQQAQECGFVKSLGSIKKKHKWFALALSGSLPPARAKHAALSIGRRMFVLGGASAEGVLDDMQVLHAETGVWLQLGCGSSPCLHDPAKTIPRHARGPPCVGHCLAFWETKLVVLGGSIGPKLQQKLSVFALDLQTQSWSILAPKGDVPIARTGQSIVQMDSSLIVFGGEDKNGNLLNDLHVLDLKALMWLPQKTTGGTSPSPRKGHTAVAFLQRYMLIFGGKAHGSYYNDLHCLDLDKMEWIDDHKQTGSIPTGRAGHAGVLVADTWYIVGGEHRGTEVSDTVSINLESRTWSSVAMVQPGSPLANDGLSLVRIRNRRRTYLVAFGGHGPSLSNQVWAMLVTNTFSSDHNELSTSSLPFNFTTGSIQTMQGVLSASLQMEEEEDRNADSMDKSLTSVLRSKDRVENRLERALHTISALERDVEALVKGKQHSGERVQYLEEQLGESQEQLVQAARKQAIAERQLVSALKQNRELKKKLLLLTAEAEGVE